MDNAHIRMRLEHLAQTDSLTGLYNHRYFHERLRAELTRASRFRDSIAVLMLDLDDFKRVNDIHGHSAGDQLLVQVARVAEETVRASDIACRIGGEEFAVIMPSCDARGGARLAARLTSDLRDRCSIRPLGDALDRCRPGAGARGEPARADRLRGGRDDDRQGPRQESGRPLRRGRHASARMRRRRGATCGRSAT